MGARLFMSADDSQPKIIDNISSLLRDDLADVLTSKSVVKIAASCFSIYAFKALREKLLKVNRLQFLFTAPTFVLDAPSTMNLAPGKQVTEIEIFEIQLKTGVLVDEVVLRLIDQGIPYHILFLLEFDEKVQVWTAYKEVEGKRVTVKPNAYYHTEWMTSDTHPLAVEGLDLDAVYEHFVYQIAGEVLQEKEGKSFQESVERAERRKKLLQQIATLQNKIHKEKQLNIQVKLNQELKQLKKTLEQM